MMKKKVLFLCTGNSARSQMAEGLLKHLASDRFEVFSAGTNPEAVHPMAIEAMIPIGIDISNHRSKSIREFLGQTFDFVITLCDSVKESCPVFPGQYRDIHWSLTDPSDAVGTDEEMLSVFAEIRDELRRRILNFIEGSGE
ncbi:MAG: arsenate reductase ArsC [Acidobacteriota bacterium]